MRKRKITRCERENTNPRLNIMVEHGESWVTSTTRVIEGRYKYQYVGKGMWKARVHSGMCHCSGMEQWILTSEYVKLLWTNSFHHDVAMTYSKAKSHSGNTQTFRVGILVQHS